VTIDSHGLHPPDRLRRDSGRIAALVAAASLFAVTLVTRVAIQDPQEPVLVLLVAPVAIIAARYGMAAGLRAAGFALLTVVLWAQWNGVPFTALDYVARAFAYLTVGGLVGFFAGERSRLLERNRRQLELAHDMICTANMEGRFTSVNPAFTKVLGYQPEELLSKPFVDFVHPDDRANTSAEAARLASGEEGTIGFRNRYIARDGTYRWLEWSTSAYPSHGIIYASARDVTDRMVLESELARAADVDALTGLYNRRRFDQALSRAVSNVERHHQSSALLIIDVDEFKTINDRQGHAAGDHSLRTVANFLERQLRALDFAARVGGDEFAVLLSNADVHDARTVGEKIVHGLGGGDPSIRVSVGIACFTPTHPPSDAEAVYRAADEAMYAAKRKGGGCVEVARV